MYAALALLWFVGAPVWLLCTAAADVVGARGRSWPRTRALGFFGLYLACELAGVALATLLWMVTLGGRIGGPCRYLVANAALQRWWTAALFKGSVWLFSMKVHVEGLELARNGPLLLFVRHVITADTILAAALVANPDRLSLRYVLKRELLWDPCLDIVGRRTRNAFVRRGSGEREKEIALLRRLADEVGSNDGVLLFPEGTRFSAAKRERALEHLRATKQSARLARVEHFHQVLPPRSGGALALLEARPDVDAAFLAHSGFEGTASLNDIWSGKLIGRTIRLWFWRVPSRDIPRDEAGRLEWLDAQWARVEQCVATCAGSDSTDGARLPDAGPRGGAAAVHVHVHETRDGRAAGAARKRSTGWAGRRRQGPDPGSRVAGR